MSGVRTGSRLAQLEELAARVAHEIDVERAAAARGERPARALPPTSEPSYRDMAMDLLDRAALPPTRVIRAWAMERGYIPETQTVGPLSLDVLYLYRDEVLS